MTQKIYKTARGTTVDIGSLKLQNESVRAVGNMGVNARGDRVNDQGQVIDSRGQQLQRQIMRQTRPVDMPVHSSMLDANQRPAGRPGTAPAPEMLEEFDEEQELPRVTESAPVAVAPATPSVPESITETEDVTGGGLAGALARSRIVKQELERTARQQQQDSGVKRI